MLVLGERKPPIMSSRPELGMARRRWSHTTPARFTTGIRKMQGVSAAARDVTDEIVRRNHCSKPIVLKAYSWRTCLTNSYTNERDPGFSQLMLRDQDLTPRQCQYLGTINRTASISSP